MEILVDGIEAMEKTETVWDKFTPIVKDGNVYDVYMSGEVAHPFEYNELCNMLSRASSKDSINIHLNTPGGHMDSALAIIDAIKGSDAFITAKMSGSVASAGTMIALACDTIECNMSLSFMIHYFSGGVGGKGNEIKAHSQFIDRHTPRVFQDMYKGFLTEEEINDVIDGKDMWLDGDEVISRFEKAKGLGDNDENREQ